MQHVARQGCMLVAAAAGECMHAGARRVNGWNMVHWWLSSLLWQDNQLVSISTGISTYLDLSTCAHVLPYLYTYPI